MELRIWTLELTRYNFGALLSIFPKSFILLEMINIVEHAS